MTKQNNLPGSRKRWAMPQRELAHLVGVSRTVISRYENGALSPSARGILALEAIFGRSGRQLFPHAYADVQDEVMRRAAKLDRTLSGRADKASERKRQLLSEMAKRGEAARFP
jgi:transcriptional regulator with XRE-family HTH domain